jgi:hypothetical protein
VVVQQTLAFLASALRPRMRPIFLRRAVLRGAVDAVLGRYYQRAEAQAQEQVAAHVSQPTAPPLVHRPAVRRPPRAPDPVIDVDITGGALTGTALHPSGPTPARRLRVQVHRDGGLQTSILIRTGGARVSTARLRWELVAAMGPAVLASPDDGDSTKRRSVAARHEPA